MSICALKEIVALVKLWTVNFVPHHFEIALGMDLVLVSTTMTNNYSKQKVFQCEDTVLRQT